MFWTLQHIPEIMCCPSSSGTRTHWSQAMSYQIHIFTFQNIAAIWYNTGKETKLPSINTCHQQSFEKYFQKCCSVRRQPSCTIQTVCYRTFGDDISCTASERSTVFPSKKLYAAYVISSLTRFSTRSSAAHCTGSNPSKVNTRRYSIVWTARHSSADQHAQDRQPVYCFSA